MFVKTNLVEGTGKTIILALDQDWSRCRCHVLMIKAKIKSLANVFLINFALKTIQFNSMTFYVPKINALSLLTINVRWL